MRTFSIVWLTSLIVVASLAQPAEAGRRGWRRAAVAVGVVAVATSRPVVVAAAVVPVARTTSGVLLPDLTITDMSATNEGHCVTVKNIGQVTSPLTQMRIDFCRVTDGVLVATKKVMVRRLLVNQSIRYRLRSVPQDHVQATAHVDPYNRVVELNEKNNDLSLEIFNQPTELIEDVDVWVEPQQPNAGGLSVQASATY
jgi:subtilase family serine protease